MPIKGEKAARHRVLVITDRSQQIAKLTLELAQSGFTCIAAPYSERTIEQITEQPLTTVLVDMDNTMAQPELWELPQRIRQKINIPIITLISREIISKFNSNLDIDDFLVKPWEPTELTVRIKRVLRRKNSMGGGDLIKHSDLVIDLTKYQVSLSGRLITLTFREFQLLKFLASNPGSVFSRETLLNKVWGWDYYGGDRTVDVHVRRLRSKIEDKNHSFIETIRSIGYRFREI